MKKTILFLITIMMMFTLTACGSKKETDNSSSKSNKISQNENDKKLIDDAYINSDEDVIIDDEILDGDEIIDFDDEDNLPPEDEKTIVTEVINCDGCVYAYFNDEGDKAKKIGSTIDSSEYTTDINNLKTMGGKQRHNFFGLVLDNNKISKAYACILKNSKIYCLEGSIDGSYHTNNIGILNMVFKADECKYISDGHTYTCTDGNYNGDTITTGYTSMHYETSCTIYGSESNTGKLICH